MSFLGSSPFTKRFDQKVTSDSSVRDSNVVTASTADVNPNKQSSMVPHYEEQDSERDSVQAKSDTRLSNLISKTFFLLVNKHHQILLVLVLVSLLDLK